MAAMVLRRHVHTAFFVSLLVGSLWFMPLLAEPTLHEPMVLERVIDGDTFMASGRRIRLWGIDAPERGDPRYDSSRVALEYFLKSGGLACAYIDTDRYGRSVMRCETDGVDLGSLMVRAGFARDFERYSKGSYAQEEDEARAGESGIWKDLLGRE